MSSIDPPLILVIDDLFGRVCKDGGNPERENLCGQFLLEDVSGDTAASTSRQKVLAPVARAVFWRGQTPARSGVGDSIENDLEGVITRTRKGWASSSIERWALVLVDLCFYTGLVTRESNARVKGMPEGRPDDDNPQRYFGLRVLQALQQELPDLPVAVLSSKSRDEVSREFSLLGAVGFVPRDIEDAPDVLQDFLWWHGLIEDGRGELVGRSKPLLRVLRAARRVAGTQRNVLIRGERGSGKELVARYINRTFSGKGLRPFVVVNSAILTPDLFASELFGIERGVATGVDARAGLLRAAHGGDLFLDEIRDMVPQAQAGILRVLEDRRVAPVGGSVAYPVEARFLSATNEDIEQLASSGAFRSDLLDRLREGGSIYLPRLRDRLEDIPLLTEHFVREAEAANPRAMRSEIDPDTIALLQSHDWPGNIRELKSVLFEAVADYPDVEHLVPVHIRLRHKGSSSDFQASQDLPAEDPSLDALLQKLMNFRIDQLSPESLAGRYSQIRAGFGGFMVRSLRAALEATRRSTVHAPEGEISIHAAARFLTGNESLTAHQAADLVKRIHAFSEGCDVDIAGDPILKEAVETALHLRPRNRKVSRD